MSHAELRAERSPLITALRTGTGLQHQRLDAAASGVPLTSDEGYLRFLMFQAAVLPGVEHWLQDQALFRTLPRHRQRLRSAQLIDDLRAMGAEPPAVPDVPDMSFLNDEASCIGICYVVEGSRLGAAHILALLGRSTSGLPMTFLQSGAEKGLWKTYLSWLDHQENSAPAATSAVLSARKLFDAYLKALKLYDHDRR